MTRDDSSASALSKEDDHETHQRKNVPEIQGLVREDLPGRDEQGGGPERGSIPGNRCADAADLHRCHGMGRRHAELRRQNHGRVSD